MSEKLKAKILFWISFVCEIIYSATFLWMPFVGNNRILLIITGLAFWIFMICGYVCIGMSSRFRKAYYLKTQPEKLHKNQKTGAFKFLSNIPAVIFDGMLITASLFAIITAFTKLKETYLPYPLLFLILLSLNAHCMFNGITYKFLNQ